jgi:hypothetical protein
VSLSAVIVPPRRPVDRTIGRHRREVSNLDSEVQNLDFTAGRRLATLAP